MSIQSRSKIVKNIYQVRPCKDFFQRNYIKEYEPCVNHLITMHLNKAVYTTAPVAGGWAGAVMSWAGAEMIWAGA